MINKISLFTFSTLTAAVLSAQTNIEFVTQKFIVEK